MSTYDRLFNLGDKAPGNTYPSGVLRMHQPPQKRFGRPVPVRTGNGTTIATQNVGMKSFGWPKV